MSPARFEAVADSMFSPTGCKLCGAPIFTGLCDGVSWRVDVTPITVEHATVLHRYGVCVLTLNATVNGLRPAAWSPYNGAVGGTPRRALVVPHICGSPHSRAGVAAARAIRGPLTGMTTYKGSRDAV